MADAFFYIFTTVYLWFLTVSVGRFDAFLEENDKYYHVFFDSDSWHNVNNLYYDIGYRYYGPWHFNTMHI